ncbi:MAG: hypothetical protein OJF58_000957 [Enhydrobacter sp.]|nr:MAG: hypothetical protein OJF58_000957 [Enhydrobacter sp.]
MTDSRDHGFLRCYGRVLTPARGRPPLHADNPGMNSRRPCRHFLPAGRARGALEGRLGHDRARDGSWSAACPSGSAPGSRATSVPSWGDRLVRYDRRRDLLEHPVRHLRSGTL